MKFQVFHGSTGFIQIVIGIAIAVSSLTEVTVDTFNRQT